MIGVPRMAGIVAATAGIGAVTARMFAEEQLPVSTTALTAGEVVAGSALTGAGLLAASRAETSLHPVLARAGRGTAAIGAGLVAGAVAGELAARFGTLVRERSDAHALRDERDAQRSRSKVTNDDVEAVERDADRLAGTTDEFDPLDKESASRMRPDDGRIDLQGSSYAAAARALYQHYDADDDDELQLSERQRVVDGQVLSIGSLYDSSVKGPKDEHSDDDPTVRFGTPGQVEAVMVDGTESSDAGERGIIDPDEAAAWYGDGPVGERNITWDGARDFASGIGASTSDVADVDYSIGPWRDAADPILYLTGVTSRADAEAQLLQISREDDQPPLALVQLHDDAPSAYGVMAVTNVGEDQVYLYDDQLAELRLDPRVLAYAMGEEVIDATPAKASSYPGVPQLG